MAKGKYQEWLEGDNLILVQGWARDGLTNEQIAHNMGISVKTLYEWQNKYSEFSDALKKTKEVVDIEVENALLKSAKGYDAVEEVWERQFDVAKGDFDLVLVKKTIKHVPASQVAQIFWLKNRRAKQWREKQEVEVNPEILNKALDILGGIDSVID
jgi:transposase